MDSWGNYIIISSILANLLHEESKHDSLKMSLIFAICIWLICFAVWSSYSDKRIVPFDSRFTILDIDWFLTNMLSNRRTHKTAYKIGIRKIICKLYQLLCSLRNLEISEDNATKASEILEAITMKFIYRY